MKLYYLTSEKYAVRILEERRVKLSTFNELNDPFELLGASLGSKRERKIYNYAKEQISKKFGLLCLSETYQSPVMWAHYGDKHKGVCLCFEFEQNNPFLNQVFYNPSRLKGLLQGDSSLKDFNHQMVLALMTMKSKEWEYEKEYRLIQKLDKVEKGKKGMYFYALGDDIKLKEIILGCRCELSPTKVEGLAKIAGSPGVEVCIKKVRPAFKEFKMVNQGSFAHRFIMP